MSIELIPQSWSCSLILLTLAPSKVDNTRVAVLIGLLRHIRAYPLTTLNV